MTRIKLYTSAETQLKKGGGNTSSPPKIYKNISIPFTGIKVPVELSPEEYNEHVIKFKDNSGQSIEKYDINDLDDVIITNFSNGALSDVTNCTLMATKETNNIEILGESQNVVLDTLSSNKKPDETIIGHNAKNITVKTHREDEQVIIRNTSWNQLTNWPSRVKVEGKGYAEPLLYE